MGGETDARRGKTDVCETTVTHKPLSTTIHDTCAPCFSPLRLARAAVVCGGLTVSFALPVVILFGSPDIPGQGPQGDSLVGALWVSLGGAVDGSWSSIFVSLSSVTCFNNTAGQSQPAFMEQEEGCGRVFVEYHTCVSRVVPQNSLQHVCVRCCA